MPVDSGEQQGRGIEMPSLAWLYDQERGVQVGSSQPAVMAALTGYPGLPWPEAMVDDPAARVSRLQEVAKSVGMLDLLHEVCVTAPLGKADVSKVEQLLSALQESFVQQPYGEVTNAAQHEPASEEAPPRIIFSENPPAVLDGLVGGWPRPKTVPRRHVATPAGRQPASVDSSIQSGDWEVDDAGAARFVRKIVTAGYGGTLTPDADEMVALVDLLDRSAGDQAYGGDKRQRIDRICKYIEGRSMTAITLSEVANPERAASKSAINGAIVRAAAVLAVELTAIDNAPSGTMYWDVMQPDRLAKFSRVYTEARGEPYRPLGQGEVEYLLGILGGRLLDDFVEPSLVAQRLSRVRHALVGSSLEALASIEGVSEEVVSRASREVPERIAHIMATPPKNGAEIIYVAMQRGDELPTGQFKDGRTLLRQFRTAAQWSALTADERDIVELLCGHSEPKVSTLRRLQQKGVGRETYSSAQKNAMLVFGKWVAQREYERKLVEAVSREMPEASGVLNDILEGLDAVPPLYAYDMPPRPIPYCRPDESLLAVLPDRILIEYILRAYQPKHRDDQLHWFILSRFRSGGYKTIISDGYVSPGQSPRDVVANAIRHFVCNAPGVSEPLPAGTAETAGVRSAAISDKQTTPMTLVHYSDDQVVDYTRAIRRIPLLNAEQEIDLAKRIEAGLFAQYKLDHDNTLGPQLSSELALIAEDGRQAKQHLIAANLRLVASLAKRFAGRGMPLADLMQEGNFGLMGAVEGFDYTRGRRFSTYATRLIVRALWRGLAEQARQIRIPANRLREVNEFLAARGRLVDEYGREPTDAEIASDMDVSLDGVRDLRLDARKPFSLHTPVGDDGDEEFGELIEDDTLLPSRVAEGHVGGQEFYEVMATLSDDEAMVIGLRYGLLGNQPLYIREIADVLGIGVGAIENICARAESKLLHPSRAGRLVAGAPWLSPTMERLVEQARCRETDPDAFFVSESSHLARLAILTCQGCEVRDACLQAALAHPTSVRGIWGGLTASQRQPKPAL